MVNSSLSQQIAHGTRWYIAMRWAIKALGFVSSAILARLLVPEDFGLVATVLVVLGFISLLFEFGVNWALIQNNNASDDDFDTAWTIRIIQAVLVALLLAVFSGVIADLYNDVRIREICLVIALATMAKGLENIGTVKFQKEMNFSKDFAYNVIPKILATVVTIALAYSFRSYYALIMATLINDIIKVIVSYCVIDYRPRLCLKKAKDIWGFSQWILIRNMANYVSTQGDLLVLSVLATPTQIGFYKWGTELSFMTISEVQYPFSRALVPGLVKIKENHRQLIAAYLKALAAMALVAVPMALGFGAISSELIPLFLGGGDKWAPVIPLVEGLVFFAMFSSLYGISSHLLTIDGHVKFTAYTFWIQALITIITLYPVYSLWGLIGIAYTRALIGLIMFFVVSYLVAKLCQVSITDILSAIWRPVVAGVLMYFLVIHAAQFYSLKPSITIILKILLGAIFYSLTTLILWLLSGAPASIEADVVSIIKGYVSRRKIPSDG